MCWPHPQNGPTTLRGWPGAQALARRAPGTPGSLPVGVSGPDAGWLGVTAALPSGDVGGPSSTLGLGRWGCVPPVLAPNKRERKGTEIRRPIGCVEPSPLSICLRRDSAPLSQPTKMPGTKARPRAHCPRSGVSIMACPGGPTVCPGSAVLTTWLGQVPRLRRPRPAPVPGSHCPHLPAGGQWGGEGGAAGARLGSAELQRGCCAPAPSGRPAPG